jgi:hypothetical protein
MQKNRQSVCSSRMVYNFSFDSSEKKFYLINFICFSHRLVPIDFYKVTESGNHTKVAQNILTISRKISAGLIFFYPSRKEEKNGSEKNILVERNEGKNSF